MNAEIYEVSFEQFTSMISEHPYRKIVLSAAKLCSEILVGMYAGKPLIYLGISPPTLLADECYAWMVVTDEGAVHPFILARYARGVRDTILLKYTRIYGDCFEEKSARWLRSLGAEFTSATQFEIRRK